MKFKTNTLSLLLEYLFLVVVQQVLFRTITDNDLLYPIETVVSIIGTLVLIWTAHQFPYSNKLEKRKSKYWWKISWGLGGVVLVLAVQRLLLLIETNILHQPAISENTGQLFAVVAKYSYYVIVIVLTQPIIEELIYRKLLFGNFTYWFRPWQTALLSSLLFALGHGDGHFLTYTGIGLVLCLVYEKTGKIQESMLTHVLMNAIILIIH